MAVLIDNRQARVRLDRPRLARAAQCALSGLGRAGGAVEIAVVGDAEIRRLNRAHRGISRRTDVLAFPMETPGAAGALVGQIVISADTASRQARRLGVPRALEMALLATHGVLHLVGYDDRDPVEAALMHRRERDLLTGARRRTPTRLWSGLLPPEPRGRARSAPSAVGGGRCRG